MLYVFSPDVDICLGVADVTIRQSYKLMLPRAKDLFPADFKFTTPIENLPQNWESETGNKEQIYLILISEASSELKGL